MGHLNVAEDVVHLLGDFFPSVLLVTLCVLEAPGVHPIQGVSPRTPLAMPPEVAMEVSIFPQVFLDVFHEHVSLPGFLGEEGLRHQVLLKAMHLFQIMQDTLLWYHLMALLEDFFTIMSAG